MRNVVYACDNKYIRQTIVSLVSLLEHNPYPFNIWVVSDYITMSNKDLLSEMIRDFRVNLTFLEIDKILDGVVLISGQRHPRTIYAKLFLENVLNVNRVLYLDSDTVINCDLSELWIRDMDEELIAGVKMPYSNYKKQLLKISSTEPYLCDGIVMINLDLWRKYKIGNKCKSYIIKHLGNPPMMSEGVLNFICQQKIGVLKPKFNLMPFMIMYSWDEIGKLFRINDFYTEYELDEARNQPFIIHYIKELYNRPWFDPCDHPYKAFYRDKYELLFNESKYEKLHLENHTKLTRLALRLLPFNIFAFLYHLKERIRRVL